MSDSGQHAIYDEAWSLLAEEGKSSEETIVALVARGHNEPRAREVVATKMTTKCFMVHFGSAEDWC